VVASRPQHRGDARALAAIMFMTISLLLITARALSPQYLLWLIAMGASVICVPGSPLRGPVLLLIPVAVLTHVYYPFVISPPLATPVNTLETYTSWLPLTVLSLRNLLLLSISAWSSWMVLKPGVVASDRTGSSERAGRKVRAAGGGNDPAP
jgi:hypothetical protein